MKESNKNMISEGIKEIVLARLKTLDKDSKILLLGFDKPLSVKELIVEVKNDTPLGKKIVEVQLKYMQMLARGEI
jgi:hypothetical protein